MSNKNDLSPYRLKGLKNKEFLTVFSKQILKDTNSISIGHKNRVMSDRIQRTEKRAKLHKEREELRYGKAYYYIGYKSIAESGGYQRAFL